MYKNKQIKDVTLELSLKPFKETSPAFIEKTARQIFQDWAPLLIHADQVSLMFWAADGSEILDYAGNLDDTFEWAKFIGGANPREVIKNDPKKIGLHSRNYLYIPNPPIFTYRIFKNVMDTLKRVGAEITGKPIRLGATFDPGPEFAKSSFKYERHLEICRGNTMGHASFVCCYATLKGDTRAYAGFPQGIPDGTTMGTFLGRQSAHFLGDLGFDYLWLSNGFGFGVETWSTTGTLFDGKKFFKDNVGDTGDKIRGFWKDFRRECPDKEIEVRGTNLSVGIDLASDGTPVDEIYKNYIKLPPPNSPWAALDGDFGIEIAGYLSRMSVLPGEDYRYRYYIHDPWWKNSPWLDRYGRSPHDIYLPLAVSCIDKNGVTKNPAFLNMLTIDDSFGNMPVECANEVTSHVLRAVEDFPDAPSPFIWVYPFTEYHRMTFQEKRLEEVFFGDWFIRDAITNGLPLSSVVSSENYAASRKKNPALYQDKILITIVPDADSPLFKSVMENLENGGKVMLYGPLDHADPKLLDLLHVQKGKPLSGEFDFVSRIAGDEVREKVAKKIQHRPELSGGGVESKLKSGKVPGLTVLGELKQKKEKRVAGIHLSQKKWKGKDGRVGGLVWLRGINAHHYPGGHLLAKDDAAKYFHGDLLMRHALSFFGYDIRHIKEMQNQRGVMQFIARVRNGFFFSGYNPDATTSVRLKFPQGAPLLYNQDAVYENGSAVYHMPKSFHSECRVFVEQKDKSVILCKEGTHELMGIRRRFLVSGLKKATLIIYPEKSDDAVKVMANPPWPFVVDGLPLKKEMRDGHCLVAKNITGTAVIQW